MHRIILILILFCGCSMGERQEEGGSSLSIKYYRDSSINEIVEMRKGQINGKGLKFNEDGTKMWEFQYTNGIREGTQLEYIHGELVLEATYSQGKAHGWARRFGGPCGWVVEEGSFSQGIMEGLWYRYHGRELLEIDLFENDSLVRIVYRNSRFPSDDRELPLNINCKTRVGREIPPDPSKE